ncbi:DNA alkylation repair protein [Pontibacter sp. JH31]|uniref:DNA alkylation repair protein n=1 Tax=Pontibacter aquaedesilientis TaxID=2766980 RepID=A0ABR7XH45_9BACT|nr:DNA alkylation repair protein [Pontibacter aquaedesilientis]MBD1397634.1 DNA alkylation repair protein [Pontibacter aquaedesilientis]
MNLSPAAQEVRFQVSATSTKLGDLKKMAKEINKNHALAMELWSTGEYYPRLLASLIIDKKLLSQELIDELTRSMDIHTFDEKNHLMEWFMANQLMKDKKTVALIQAWENSPLALQRRTYWYYQARLRWTGQTPPDNTPELLSKIEANLASEAPEVQWAMNFTAAWIGVYDEKYRNRCMLIGEKTGLYRDEMVAKGCTPSYLPAFIEIEVSKRRKA